MNKENQIEEMAREMCHLSAECKTCQICNERYHGDDDDLCYFKCVAKEIINHGYRKQSEWISVEERLPESGVHCILCCDMKRIDGTHSQYVCDGYFAERWKVSAHYADDDCATEYNEEDDEYYLKEGWYEVIKNWDDYNSIVIGDTVTHWMPLPEAPKGGAK